MIEVLSVIDQTCWLVGVVTPIRAVLGGSSVLPVIRFVPRLLLTMANHTKTCALGNSNI